MALGQINLLLMSVLKHLCNIVETVLELSKVTGKLATKIPKTMFDFFFLKGSHAITGTCILMTKHLMSNHSMKSLEKDFSFKFVEWINFVINGYRCTRWYILKT